MGSARPGTQRVRLLRSTLGAGLAVVCAFVVTWTGWAPGVQAQTPDKAAVTAAQKADQSRVQALSRRVEQLEEQIVDLQVVIGTLESLARTGGAPGRQVFTSGRAAAGSGASAAALETQVNALSAQVAKLSGEVRSLQAARSGQGGVPPQFSQQQNGIVQGPPVDSSSFGATTINPAVSTDQIGTLIEAQPPASPQTAAEQLTEPAPNAAGEAPKLVYEAAYNLLLQQDYNGAQSGFRAFLRKFPEHTLVPNALYWLGETYYVQQNYADAAEAFDIVTAAYASSNKAPDSQLKRGMSLANLGKRLEACSVFRSLAKRYPNAPPHVKTKADSERQRVGCS